MLIFHAIDWQWFHKCVDDKEIYTIQIYGRQKDGKSVCVNVNNFTPYFFIKIPTNWNTTYISKIIEKIKTFAKAELKDSLIEYKLIKKYDIDGFTNCEKILFLQLIFDNYNGYKLYEKIIEKHNLELYESNVDPLLRCIHLSKIDACGWIEIDDYTTNNGDYMSTCEINVETHWKNLKKHETDDISKMIIMSFDIECYNKSGKFPMPQNNDPIILIASTFNKFGDKQCFYNYVVSLKEINEIENVDVEWFGTEDEVILAWSRMVKRMCPDVMTGYNIFGFDYEYIFKRATILGIEKEVSKNLSKLLSENARFRKHSLCSSAIGENFLQYYNPKGIVQIDLFKSIQKDYKLDYFSLNYVSSYFIKEEIKNITNKNDETLIYTDILFGIKKDIYITIKYNDGISDIFYKDKQKFKIKCVYDNYFSLTENIGDDIYLIYKKNKLYWSQTKDDISVNKLFSNFVGSSDDRTENAKYCIQDCALCNILMDKLQIIVNNVGMANVTSVPLYFLFIRGQTVKGYSLFSKKCNEMDYLIKKRSYNDRIKDINQTIQKKETQSQNNDDKDYEKDEEDEEFKDEDFYEDYDGGFKGAYVLPPMTGLHTEPVVVLDYASLYPSCMIEYNMSLETLVKNKKYLGNPNFDYLKITFEDSNNEKHKSVFVKDKSGKLGIIPQILMELLDARNKTKKEMKNEKNPSKYQILDGRQLAFKISANSIYGLTGAAVSPLFCKKIAGSTTAAGRLRLLFAKDFIENKMFIAITFISENNFEGFKNYMMTIYDNVDKKKYQEFENETFYNSVYDKFIILLQGFTINPKIIYGDTDSVFFILYLKHENEEINNDMLKKRIISIEFGKMMSNLMKYILPNPHDIQYEKTMNPFCILAKKRYVGNLYENDANKKYLKYMGIVLKRRDSAPIVKIICNGIIDNMLNNSDRMGAINYTHDMLNKIINHNFPLEKFVISKTLGGHYKFRSRIAHAVLADRIKSRDAGACPQVNDRMQYAFIVSPPNVKLQGNRIESVQYIIQNSLKLDYLFYITNQIMEPACQFLEILCENPKKTIFEPYILVQQRTQNKMKSMYQYFSTEKIVNDEFKIKNIIKEPSIQTKNNDDNKKDSKNKTIMSFFKKKI